MKQAYDTVKGDLTSKETYLENSVKMEILFFVVFPLLSIRFRILNTLKVHNLLGKISVNEII